jgi:predicted RNase H-like nuclease
MRSGPVSCGGGARLHDGPVNAHDWRRRLSDLLAEGVAVQGDEPVRAALLAEIDRLAAASSPAQLVVDRPVLGVDACRAGWVAVQLRPSGPPTAHAGASIGALVEQVRESGDLAVVAVDIPIGLPDRHGRAADALARQALPGKSSSVFSTATRSAYAAATYDDAKARNIAATGGTSLSRQAWALGPKILEVDAWLRTRPTVDVIEVHPELSFARMSGAPILVGKKDSDGVHARRVALALAGITPPAWFRGSGFGEDDLLDACAAAWTAARFARGDAESLPPEPEVFSDGLPAAIWV